MSARSCTTIIVFARVPLPGQAKTRLAPVLGEHGAASLAMRMLHHAVAQAVGADMGPVELCMTPESSHPLVREIAATYPIQLSDQGAGDLGERMHRAFVRHLGPSSRALLMGTDAPSIDAAMLRKASSALDDVDAVFIPALDGGYALMGQHRADPRLLMGMTWSHARVMQQTRDRLRHAGLRWAELPAVADVDEPADLRHVPPDWLEGLARTEPGS